MPQKATVKSAGGSIRSPGDPTYDAAMVYLTTKDTITGLTPVDIYIWKQKLWAEAQDVWEHAKSTAQRKSSYQSWSEHTVDPRPTTACFHNFTFG